MAKFRVNKNKNYTCMSNQHLKNKNISLKAKGLLSVMLSLPNDWNYSIEGLVSISKENETAIQNTLKELKENGYLEVTKLLPNQTTTGRYEYIYDIFEKPRKQELEKQDLENLGVENLGVEIQDLENMALYKYTKELNTKELNINNNINNTNNTTIYEYIEENFKRGLTPIEYEEIGLWEDNELTRYAIKQSILNNVYSIKYISRILQSYKQKGIESVQQAQQEEERFKNNNNKQQPTFTKKSQISDKKTFDPSIDVEEDIPTEEELKAFEELLKR